VAKQKDHKNLGRLLEIKMYEVYLSITMFHLMKSEDLHLCNQKQTETWYYRYISMYS